MAAEVPSYSEFMYPTLQATFHLGGSGSIGEIVERVVKQESYADEQQAVLHNDGPGTEIEYRLAWARSYLKALGLLTNSARGVWALTDEGLVCSRTQRLRRHSDAGPCGSCCGSIWHSVDEAGG